MRWTLLLLLAAASAVFAQDQFPSHLRVFEDARRKTLEPGAQAKVYPALEALVATGDVRAVKPLASYLVETLKLEEQVFAAIRETQQVAARANERMDVLTKEINHLRLKEKAGDQTVGPEIEKRLVEHAQQSRTFDRLRQKVESLDRTVGFVRELRDRLADGSAELLQGLPEERQAAGLGALQEALDVADRAQALFLVRILDDCALPGAEGALLDVLAHPKADAAVRRKVQYALVPGLTRRGAETLLRLWEQDPDGLGEHARHVLGLAAHRRLSDPESARAWIATLPDS